MELSSTDPGAPPPRRRVWFRRESISLADLGVQMISVIAGILIALAIDGWKKDREAAQQVRTAMQAVHGELEANRQQLQTHRKALHELTQALAAKQQTQPAERRPCNDYDGWHGVGIPVLTDAAQQSVLATQAFAHADIAAVQSIAAAYGRQKMYMNYHDLILQSLLQMDPRPLDVCKGLIDELARFADAVDTAYAAALPAATH